MIDPVNRADESLASVGSSNWQGGVSAVQHLVELGHRRIAMLRGYACLVDDARYHGYVAALTEAGWRRTPALVRPGGLPVRRAAVGGGGDPAAGRTGRPRCSRPTTWRPSAWWRRPAGSGLAVPEDLSVVGFDDSVLATTASPR